ncbi:MAG TPA: cysteine desulfurase family protein [Chloroflexia bacterium]|jgi:cysteine desulfurase
MIYLDYHATTLCDPRVVEAMLPYFGVSFGNPSSTIHEAGQNALSAVDTARQQVADLIGARPGAIIFTAGATESNNLAILGLALGTQAGYHLGVNTQPKRRRIVTTAIEHKSVLGPCHALEQEGYEVVTLPVRSDGRVDLEAARGAIADGTLLVAVQAANNEIGTIQPIAEIAEMAHAKGALILCDAAQAVGKIPVDVEAWDVDLLSISAHKMYGPKGVGALYIRGGAYGLPIKPLMYGGGQERELRPGTLNVPGIVGFGAACALSTELMLVEAKRVSSLRDSLEKILIAALPHVRRNGALDNRLPGNSSITFPELDAEALIANLPNIAVSTGSACTSGAPEPSHVLTAIGLDRQDAYSTVRIGIGRFTTESEIALTTKAIVEAAERLTRIQALV